MKKLLKILLVLFGSFWVLYLAMELFFTIPYYTGVDGHAVVKILIGLVLSAGPLYYALKKLWVFWLVENHNMDKYQNAKDFNIKSILFL